MFTVGRFDDRTDATTEIVEGQGSITQRIQAAECIGQVLHRYTNGILILKSQSLLNRKRNTFCYYINEMYQLKSINAINTF